jgi:hypothetical protein
MQTAGSRANTLLTAPSAVTQMQSASRVSRFAPLIAQGPKKGIQVFKAFRGGVGGLGVVVLGVLGFGVGSVPAVALVAHSYAGQFGSVGVGGGAFAGGGPNGLVVEQSGGGVFVLDPVRTNSEGLFAPRVERFSAAGDFVGAFGVDAGVLIVPTALAFDAAGAGSVYVGGLEAVAQVSGSVLKYSAAGVFDGAVSSGGSGTTFGYPVVLAVDPADGTLYVNGVSEATGLPVIDVFDSTGKFVTHFDGSKGSPDGGFGAVAGVAVDAAHRLYVTDGVKARTDRYDAAGEWQATVDDGSRGAPSAVAVDPVSGELEVLEAGALGQQITRFSAGGAAPVESFGVGHITAAGAIAVTHSSGTVYTADAGVGVVERFTTFIAPSVSSEAASGITASAATLNGTINPEGVAGATTYHFEWGVDGSYGNPTPETDTGGGSADVPATATITGLTPGTTYHYRLDGTNGSGSSMGADETFTSAAAAPAVDVQGPTVASAITTTGATLNDVVNPNGADTTYRYEYGTDTSYGASTPDGDAGSTTGESPAVVPVTGLTPGTTYHARIVAENGVGAPVDGADSTFTTAPATTPTATSITSNSATLNASVIPGATGSSYHFEYGTTTAYGTSTPELGLGAGAVEVPVSSGTFALQPGTQYHFRLVATTNGQTVSSDDETFTTIPAAAVTTTPVTGVTPMTATLNATIDTHGVAGAYSFAVTSPDSAYAATTTPASLSAASGPQSVSVALEGIPPGAHYIVRASATVAGTTVWGEPVTFETPALPPFTPTPPPPVISANPYGCLAPHINPVNAHPRAGDTVTVTGTDLGVGGTIALGTTQIQPSTWTATAFTFVVPDATTGTQPLTINCGTASNTVGVAIAQAPSNAFTITNTKVKGTTATLTINVPGPGRIQVSGANTSSASKTVTKASTTRLTIHLTKASKKTLANAKNNKLTTTAHVTYTPTAGNPATHTHTITYKHTHRR